MGQRRPLLQEIAPEELLSQDQQIQEQAPGQKIPGGPVPQPRQKPHRQQVQGRPAFPLPIASQGDVHIVPEPGPQAHMPPPPEARHGPGGIGMVKIPGQLKAQHPAQAPGHFGIPAEIEIDLEGIGQDPHPGQGRGHTLKAQDLNLAPQAPQLVRQQHLHGQTPDEQPQSLIKALHGVPPLLHLGPQDPIWGQGTGQELGKQQHFPGVAQEIFLRPGAPVHVRQIPRHLEGVKAHAQGQEHTGAPEAGPLEPGQQAEQQHQGPGQQPLPVPALLQAPPQAIGHKDQRRQKGQIPQPVPGPQGVEHQASQHQGPVSCSLGQNIVNHQHQGQKAPQKGQTVKGHTLSRLSFRAGFPAAPLPAPNLRLL